MLKGFNVRNKRGLLDTALISKATTTAIMIFGSPVL